MSNLVVRPCTEHWPGVLKPNEFNSDTLSIPVASFFYDNKNVKKAGDHV